MEEHPIECPNCSERMTLQSVKKEQAKSSATVFECKSCKLSIAETIADDPDKRTLR